MAACSNSQLEAWPRLLQHRMHLAGNSQFASIIDQLIAVGERKGKPDFSPLEVDMCSLLQAKQRPNTIIVLHVNSELSRSCMHNSSGEFG